MDMDPEVLDSLQEFLSFPLSSAEKVLEKFRALPGSIAEQNPADVLQQFVYVPGTRKDRVVLVAHADTVWDELYETKPASQRIICTENSAGQMTISGENKDFGIGADDRAGCAILWLLRDMGHSLLILNGEESGQQGADYLKNDWPTLFKEINQHNFALQFDRRNASDYKVYHLPVSQKFHQYIQQKTGYTEPNRSSCTDICTLCQDICGANLSIGYYNEHKSSEYLNVEEWYHTLSVTRKMLAKRCPKFPMGMP